ncbi:MAG: YbaN family protein [Thermoplasmata archaeon]|nr:YbaN family protein [Thermoplasmata archaeon]
MEEEALERVGSDLVEQEKGDECNKKGRLASAFWVTLGTISLVLGIIGIFLPLLPTTPFLLLSAACYCRGSDKMHTWLVEHKLFGKYIKDYEEQRGIRKRVKAIAILTMWASIIFCIVFFVQEFIIHIALFIIAFLVTMYLLSLKTL